MKSNNIAAPCGIYCGTCRAYLALKKELLEEKGLKLGCQGCRIRNKNCTFIRRDCSKLRKKEIEYCYECDDMPCNNLKKLDKIYIDRYSLSLIKNLKRIEEIGENSWLQEKKELYTCPDCGGEICIHDGECYDCGLKINPNIVKE
jgi:hypothetical protein